MQAMNIFHVLVAIAMVAFVLLQRGPGATAGAAFGSGASGTVFGSRGASSFLSRSTWVLAALFCLISLTMAVVVSRNLSTPEPDLGVVSAPAQVEERAPTAPAGDIPAAEATDVPALESGEPAAEVDDLPAVEPEPGEEESGSGDGSEQ